MLERGPIAALALLAGLAGAFTASDARAHDPSPLVDYTMGWGDAYDIDPTRDWRTIETEHFLVTFPAEIESGAARLSYFLEKAHAVLTIDLRWAARAKAQVLVMDNIDAANGLATPLFRFGMILYLTPPEAQSNIAYTDNWLWMLAVHEYTHFLNMDATRGYAQVLRTVLGDGILPNTTLPAWFLEGLAVVEETRWSGGGRGRAPYYPGIMRSAAAEGRLGEDDYVTLDRVNGEMPWFPFGDTPYQYGYPLLNYLARTVQPGSSADGDDSVKDGIDALGLFSWRGGGRIPYFIDDNLYNVIGKDWASLWRGWVADEKRRREEEDVRLRTQAFSEIEPFTNSSHEESTSSSGGVVSPDGQWLAYTAGSAHRIGGLYLRNLATGETLRPFDKQGGARMSFSPDSHFLFLSKLDQRDRFYTLSDLWVYDLEKRCLRRLTDGMRARDPSVSPDGNRIAFTLNEGARSWIAVAELKKSGDDRWEFGEIRHFKQGPFDSASHPAFWGNDRVVYGLRPEGQARVDLRLLRLSETQPRDDLLYGDGNFNRSPFAFDDKTVGFVSNRTGVDNVYRLSSGSTRPEMITHVRGGLGLPSRFDADSVVATSISAGGINLARVKLAKQPYDAAALTLPPPPVPPAPRERPSLAGVDSWAPASRPYSAWDSLAPRVWGPFGSVSSVEARVGAFIGGLDALDRHGYFLWGQYVTVADAFEGIASYTYRGLGPRLNLTYSDQIPIVASSGMHLRERTASVALTYPYRFTFSTLSTTIGADATQDSIHLGSSQRAFQPAIPSAVISLTYDRKIGSQLAVHSEYGGETTLGAKTYLEATGPTTKVFLSEEENIHLGGHWVLTPAVRGQWTSRAASLSATQARVAGRSGYFTNPLDSASLSFLPLRGYPGTLFAAKTAFTGSLDLAFPLFRLFRGKDVLPFFVNQFYGVAFVESAFFPGLEAGAFALPSAGGGLRLDWSALLRIPLTFVMEAHYGFALPQGGGWDFVFGLNLNALAI